MKPVNILIIVLVVAFLCSSYLLADRVYQRMNKGEHSPISKMLATKVKDSNVSSPETAPSKAELEVKEALLNTKRPPVLPPPTIEVSTAATREQQTERPQAPPQKKEVRPVRDIKVVMYMTSWCPYCKKAKDYINSQGVSLIEYDIERDRNAEDEMVKKTGGSHGVPVVDVEGIIIRGYSAEAISSAIKQKQNSSLHW
jgi:glutaredoxin-like YruB-family protein